MMFEEKDFFIQAKMTVQSKKVSKLYSLFGIYIQGDAKKNIHW